MRHFAYESRQEYTQIIQYIEDRITPFFLSRRDLPERISKLNDKKSKLDTANPAFASMRQNLREYIRILIFIVTPCLCIFIDYLILLNGLNILCEKYSIGNFAKYASPVALVVVEIGLGYLAVVEQRNSIHRSWIGKALRYCIIGFLIAFSLLVIVYSSESYNPQFDGASKDSYLFGVAFVQIALLIPSTMLHIWVIRNSEGIAESIAYLIYESKWKKITRELKRMETRKRKDTVEFIKMVQRLIKAIEAFKNRYPEANADFNQLIPYDLAQAINRVMGWEVFKGNGHYTSVDNKMLY